MKRIWTGLLGLMLAVVLAFPASAAGASAPPVFVNGQRLMADSTPVTDKTGVYVPYKPVFAALGYASSYDAKAKLHVLKNSAGTITFTAGSKSASVNGQKKKLSLAPKAIGSTVYIPLSFMNETVKKTAVYDKINHVVHIGKTAPVDQWFQMSFGLTKEQVKKLEKNKLGQSGKDENGDDQLIYLDAKLPNGEQGSIYYTFKKGKLALVYYIFGGQTDDFDATLDSYIDHKDYLDLYYNKGVEAGDIAWYADDDLQARYAEEFADDEMGMLETALTVGDLDFEATYDTNAYTATINMTNLNADESDDPYYIHMLVYVKK